jgi:rare lipoprotein A
MRLLQLTLITLLFSVTDVSATTMKSSWYDCATPGQCSKNKKTASGQIFNPNAFTAAHRTLPFGTRLKVTHKGRSVIVTVNDRGPFVKGRHLDLSRAAARAIGCKGICTVTVHILSKKKS